MADLKKRRLGPTEMRLVAMGNDFEGASAHMNHESTWEYACEVALEIGFGQHPLTKVMYTYAKNENDALEKGKEQALADLGERALDAKAITAHITMYGLRNKAFSRTVERLTYDRDRKSWVSVGDIDELLRHIYIIHDRRDRKLTEELHGKEAR